MNDTVVSVSELVVLINQSLDYAYPTVVVEGEVSGFKISKNRWVYFDLKDEESTLRFFGSFYQLKTPLEDGMLIKVQGRPRLHNLYGFSVNVDAIELSGEGTIARAQALLKAKLEKEGLFAEERKRPLPEYPQAIGLVTSSAAAAYGDFFKILNSRWGGVEVRHIEVGVQGEAALPEIVSAINHFSAEAEPVDVVVVIRGGGSLEDLSVFSTEPVVRAVASSRIPTIVGIGHETDTSLAELAADVRASTPTNAAQIVVPDRQEVISQLVFFQQSMRTKIENDIDSKQSKVNLMLERIKHGLLAPSNRISELRSQMNLKIVNRLELQQAELRHLQATLQSVNPRNVLARGYSITKNAAGEVVKNSADLKKNDELVVEFSKGKAKTRVENAG